MLQKSLVLPVVKLSVLKKLLFTSIFTALSIVLPWFCHQFGIAGSVFLPMHFFVLIAGLLCGWQVGLLAGALTPLLSFLTSGMPLMAVLPQITLEIAIYGLAAGLLREVFKKNLFISLIGAMLLGRLALGIFVFISAGIDPLVTMQSVITVGWIGIIIQLAIITSLVKKIKKIVE